MSERSRIIDSRTGKRVTIASYPNAESAHRDIADWQKRHDRGGRPDITQELIDHMTVAPEV